MKKEDYIKMAVNKIALNQDLLPFCVWLERKQKVPFPQVVEIKKAAYKEFNEKWRPQKDARL